VLVGVNIIVVAGQLQQLDLRNDIKFLGQGKVKTATA
jgi:hypothetical protein